jgi:aspartyl-tRNA(Asn)/glutamyl-tRNA(Gln) amidotransferase subunit B
MGTPGLVEYYKSVFDYVVARQCSDTSLVSKWIVHRLLGELSAVHISFANNPVASERIGDIILAVCNGAVSNTSGGLILKHVVSNPGDKSSIGDMVKQFGLQKVSTSAGDELDRLCRDVVEKHPDVVARVLGPKPSSIKYLVGQVMRASRGRMSPDAVEEAMRRVLNM